LETGDASAAGKRAVSGAALDTPVVVCIFDRPEMTKRVLEAIAPAQPRDLFIIADGPGTPEEADRCAQALAITETPGWTVEVHYEVSKVNIGARRRFDTGMRWVFSQVEEAIVLEDDCIPDATFFPFCATLLDRYRHDPRVMMISGGNYMQRWKEDQQSYHFSRFGSTYGWATWRRAWSFYDTRMLAWGNPGVRRSIREYVGDDEVYGVQAPRFDRIYADADNRHCWDLQWVFARLEQRGLAVVPAVNLVSNIGNVDGRGLAEGHSLASMPTAPLRPPLRSPEEVAPDDEYDLLHIRRIWPYSRAGDRRRLARHIAAVAFRIGEALRNGLKRDSGATMESDAPA
jgi:hypothetical protein